MVTTVPQLIAAINPDLYYKVSDKKDEAVKELKDFKKLIEDKGALTAAAKAKPKALAEHLLVYDSPTETLEPVYFWLLDLLDTFGISAEKIADSFTSSPGSGHFSELMGKATAMQQQVSRIMGDINNVLRSTLNLVYDLKEFRTRLQVYDDYKDAKKKDVARQALKQIWLDKVDINKGQGAIHAMATGQLGFATLRDAFLIVNNETDVEKLDLNDRVKRVLIVRIYEFNTWIGQSEKELRKRYEIERSYLRGQVNNLKLYSRWVKPYLQAATKLEQGEEGRNPELVTAFNSLLLDLTLLGTQEQKPEDLAASGKLSTEFKKWNLKRKYYSIVLLDFHFRGIPTRTQQGGYVTGGRVSVTFRAYSLNQEELDKLNELLKKTDLSDVLQLIEGITEDSMGQMQKEIDYFLEGKDEEEEKEEKKKKEEDEGSNPFKALIGGYDKKDKEVKKEKKKDEEIVVAKESWGETLLRQAVSESVKEITFKLFDVYKKAHGMVSFT